MINNARSLKRTQLEIQEYPNFTGNKPHRYSSGATIHPYMKNGFRGTPQIQATIEEIYKPKKVLRWNATR